jgi:hypothetical protein
VIGVLTSSEREERTQASLIFDGVTSKSSSSAYGHSANLSGGGGRKEEEKAYQFCDRLQDLTIMMLI